MNLSKVKAKVDEVGRGELEIDGVDVSHAVKSFSMRAGVGNVTEITLVVMGEWEYEGLARVVPVQIGLNADIIDTIEPAALEKRARELPWGDTKDLVANVLTVLKELITDAAESR